VAGAAEHERELLEDRVGAGLLLYNLQPSLKSPEILLNPSKTPARSFQIPLKFSENLSNSLKNLPENPSKKTLRTPEKKI